MILLLLILLSVITIIFAVMAEKKKAKFFFGMQPGESIYASEDRVNYYKEDKLLADTGILYLTNNRLIFFKYKYTYLGFIPFFGRILEAIFIDENLGFEIPVNIIDEYQFRVKKSVTSRNRTVVGTQCDTHIITKTKETYHVNIPMSDSSKEKPELLMHLDLMLLEK